MCYTVTCTLCRSSETNPTVKSEKCHYCCKAFFIFIDLRNVLHMYSCYFTGVMSVFLSVHLFLYIYVCVHFDNFVRCSLMYTKKD